MTPPSRRVFFVGDSADYPGFSRIGEGHGPFEVAMIPIGARVPRWFMQSVYLNAERRVRTYLDLCAPHESAGHTQAAALPSDSFSLLLHGETWRA